MAQAHSCSRKVTRQDVAEAVGVSGYTVSQAMAGRWGVSLATRNKVLRAAEDLGYRPNVLAGLLARSGSGRGLSKIVLAHVSSRAAWNEKYLTGTTYRNVGIHYLYAEDFDSPSMLERVLWARGVHGICFNFSNFPWTEPEMLDVDWSRFSLVKQARNYERFTVNLVRHSAFDYVRLALRKLRERGFRRIAVLLHESGSAVDDEARLGAILVAQKQMLAEGKSLECRYWQGPFSSSDDVGGEMWLRAYKPDVVLTFIWSMIKPLMRAGWRFPKDAAFASILRPKIGVNTGTPTIAGCQPQQIECVDRWHRLLCEMAVRGECGLAKFPTETVIEPIWEEGETLTKKRRIT